MIIKVLGTGTSQGVPIIGCQCEVCTSKDPRDQRLRSSINIQTEGLSLQIDVGPDFRQQALRAAIADIDAVLLTHQHNDHIAGVDDLRPYNYKYHKAIPIYAQADVCEDLIIRYAYAFSTHFKGTPELILEPIEAFQNLHFKKDGGKEVSVLPLRVMHGSLPILGYRLNSFAYLTDVKALPEESMEQLRDLDVLMLSALHHDMHPTHETLAEAIELAQRIDAKQTYFFHSSHYIGTHESVQQQLPKHMYLAYDGLELKLLA